VEEKEKREKLQHTNGKSGSEEIVTKRKLDK